MSCKARRPASPREPSLTRNPLEVDPMARADSQHTRLKKGKVIPLRAKSPAASDRKVGRRTLAEVIRLSFCRLCHENIPSGTVHCPYCNGIATLGEEFQAEVRAIIKELGYS